MRHSDDDFDRRALGAIFTYTLTDNRQECIGALSDRRQQWVLLRPAGYRANVPRVSVPRWSISSSDDSVGNAPAGVRAAPNDSLPRTVHVSNTMVLHGRCAAIRQRATHANFAATQSITIANSSFRIIHHGHSSIAPTQKVHPRHQIPSPPATRRRRFRLLASTEIRGRAASRSTLAQAPRRPRSLRVTTVHSTVHPPFAHLVHF